MRARKPTRRAVRLEFLTRRRMAGQGSFGVATRGVVGGTIVGRARGSVKGCARKIRRMPPASPTRPPRQADAGRCRRCGRPYTAGEVEALGILRTNPAERGG